MNPHLSNGADHGTQPAIPARGTNRLADAPPSRPRPSALSLYVPLLLGLVSALACCQAINQGLHIGFGFPLLFSIPLAFSFMFLRLPSLVLAALALLGIHYGYHWPWSLSALVVVIWCLVYFLVIGLLDPSRSNAKGRDA